MARIQKIEPTLNRPTIESPNVIQRDPGALSDAVIALGKTGQEIGAQIQRAGLLVEKTRAQNILREKLSEIQGRAAQDNDISEQRKTQYFDEIKRAQGEAARAISVPFERELFNEEAKNRAGIAQARVSNDFTRKTIELGKAELDVFMEGKREDFVSAENPKDKEQALLEREAKIDEAVDAGFLTPAQAVEMRAAKEKEWAVAQVEFDIENDPIFAKQALEEGVYENLSSQEKVVLKKKADTAINKRAQQIEEDILDRILEDQVTIDDVLSVKASKEEGGIGAKRAEQLVRKLEAQQRRELGFIKQVAPDSEKYINLVEAMVDDRTDEFKFKQLLVDTFTDGVIEKPQEAEKLKTLKKSLVGLRDNRESGFFKNLVKKVNLFAQEQSDEIHEQTLRNLINSIDDINEPKEGLNKKANEIIQEQKRNINPAFDYEALPKQGQLFMDKNGNKIRVFPDGTEELVL